MKRLILLIFMVTGCFVTYQLTSQQKISELKNSLPSKALPSFKDERVVVPFSGETITYSVKKLGVRAGTATLTFKGLTKLEGEDAYLAEFSVKALNFSDVEKIYLDPATLYPIIVKRDVKFLGKHEKIIEDYASLENSVRVIKIDGEERTEQVIEKSARVDNIYCFIYRHRLKGSFKAGEKLTLNLPTQEITVDLVNQRMLKTAGREFHAYYLESDSRKYRMWFDSGPYKIPLRIDGAVGFGNMVMVMTDYSQ